MVLDQFLRNMHHRCENTGRRSPGNNLPIVARPHPPWAVSEHLWKLLFSFIRVDDLHPRPGQRCPCNPPFLVAAGSSSEAVLGTSGVTSLASLSGQGGCGVGVGESPFPSGSRHFEAPGAEALKAGGDGQGRAGLPSS